MATKLFNLFALAVLAVLASTYTVAPVTAVSAGHQHLNRQVAHGHIAKRANSSKRANTQRCKQRSSSSLVSSSTSKAAEHTVNAQAKTTAAPSSSQAPASKAPVSKSSSKPASPSPTPAPSNGNKKLCLAWPNGPGGDLQYYASSPAVHYIYSWSPDDPNTDPKYDNLEFMPMIWGSNQEKDFDEKVVAGYANIMLGINEPNESGQSNMSPSDAASLWKAHVEPKRALGYKACSPATSSNPNGFTWMQNFMDACNGGCTLDYICVHWYDVKFSDFQTYVTKWHDTYKVPVLITEFAPTNFNGGAQPTTSDAWTFYQSAMPWIMATDWIMAACPFGFMHGLDGVDSVDLLMATDGKPTDLGSYLLAGNY